MELEIGIRLLDVSEIAGVSGAVSLDEIKQAADNYYAGLKEGAAAAAEWIHNYTPL